MIKGIFFNVFLILFLAHNSIAQVLQVGPRVGLNLSTINGLQDSRVRPGTAVGAFISYAQSNVGFSADMLISSKGARTTREFTTNTTSEIWDSYSNLVYLETPILVNVYLSNEEHQFRPKLFAGPSVAFKLGASESMNYRKDVTNGSDSSFSSNERVSATYKEIDLGCILGLGFNYQMSNRTYFNFDARYTLGILDIQKEMLHNELYNRNITIFLGIGYQIGK